MILVVGCTYFAPNKAALQHKMEERGRELSSGALVATREAKEQITATRVALDTGTTNARGDVTIVNTNFNNATQHLWSASSAVILAENMLNRNENLQGKPIVDQTAVVKNLLGENTLLRLEAQVIEKHRQSQEEAWAAKEANYERKLLNYGQQFEKERNDKITKWLKWGSIIIGTIAAIVAVMVFFPPASAFLIGLFPKLIGLASHVPVVVANNITRAVGDVRQDFKKRAEVAPEKTYTATEVEAIIDTTFRGHINDDKATRNVVDYLREKNNV